MARREEEDDNRFGFITYALRSVHTVKALCLEAPVRKAF